MDSPTISVVMSIYNEPEEWLKDSIESILNQTFSDLEFIIVNDNPERALNNELLDRYKVLDNRIIRLDNLKNMGLTRSLNKAYKATKGAYVARMDADDIALPKRLQLQLEFMEQNPNIGVCGTWIRYFDGISLFSARVNKLPCTPKDIQTAFLFSNPLVHPTTFIRRTCLDLTQNVYDEQCMNAQDYVLWEKLSDQSVKLANIGKVLLRYRVSKEQISHKQKKNQNQVANAIQLRALEKVGISLSDLEKDLFVMLLNRNVLDGIQRFEAAEQLLLRIRTMMSKNLEFNKALVEKYVHLEWVSCFMNVRTNGRPWKKFLTSSIFRFRYFRLRDLAKIVLTR